MNGIVKIIAVIKFKSVILEGLFYTNKGESIYPIPIPIKTP